MHGEYGSHSKKPSQVFSSKKVQGGPEFLPVLVLSAFVEKQIDKFDCGFLLGDLVYLRRINSFSRKSSVKKKPLDIASDSPLVSLDLTPGPHLKLEVKERSHGFLTSFGMTNGVSVLHVRLVGCRRDRKVPAIDLKESTIVAGGNCI